MPEKEFKETSGVLEKEFKTLSEKMEDFEESLEFHGAHQGIKNEWEEHKEDIKEFIKIILEKAYGSVEEMKDEIKKRAGEKLW